jgi:hypothetical protein
MQVRIHQAGSFVAAITAPIAIAITRRRDVAARCSDLGRYSGTKPWSRVCNGRVFVTGCAGGGT